MSDINFIEYLLAKLTKEHDSIRSRVGEGSCKDIESYRELTGQVKGLKKAIDITKKAHDDLKKDLNLGGYED